MFEDPDWMNRMSSKRSFLEKDHMRWSEWGHSGDYNTAHVNWRKRGF